MSLLRRWGSLSAVAIIALAAAPSAMASAPTPIDTVTATGSGTDLYGDTLNAADIRVQSGPDGQNVSGTASLTETISLFGGFTFTTGGPVTCMSVTGQDTGAGTAAAPTTAVVNFEDTSGFNFGVVTVVLVDNGGDGHDTLSATAIGPGRAANDCSPPSNGSAPFQLTDGRAAVVDTPVPTSIAQCLNGGWRSVPAFTNEGNCVDFVETGK